MTLDTLLADVPPTDTEAWQAALARELKGGDPARLAWRVADGLTLPPLLRAADVTADVPLLRRLVALLPAAPPALVPWSAATESAAPLDERRYSEAGAEGLDALVFTLQDLAARLDGEDAPEEITMGVGPSVLLEAARLRALRLLAERLRAAYGHAPAVRVHAVTSRFTMTLAAPHTNLLRGTLGAFAAFMGCADAVTIRPHTLLTGLPDAHARRIAENVYHLLIHEGHLTRPFASGAYALDRLTAEIARAVWARLQAAPHADPAVRATRIAAALTRTDDAVASGKLRLVGTNVYADASDTVGDEAPPLGDLPMRRAAEGLEAFRRAVASAGAAPDVVLLRFGDPAMSSARATFARGLLAVAGIGARESTQAAEARGAALVVLCSSDDGYTQQGAAVVAALPSGSARVLAGPESALTDALRGAGVTTAVHARMPLLDAVQTLTRAAGLDA